MVAAVADGLSLADPALLTGVRGLVSSSEWLADILTLGALPGTATALDMTIASQDAVHAGLDACASAHRRKMNRYSHILPALRRAGDIFQPMVGSTEGQPHPATVRVLDCAVRQVRSKRGEEAATELGKRWRHDLCGALQRRKAAIIRAVLPDRTRRCEWLARGGADMHEAGDARMPGVEEEEDDERIHTAA